MKTAGYAKVNECISRGINVFGLKPRLLVEVKKKLLEAKNPRVLEVGCGKGFLLLDLLKQFPNLRLTGVNKSKAHGIKDRKELAIRAREYGLTLNTHQTPNIIFSDATNLPFPSSFFDIAVSQVTFLHIRNKAEALSEIFRVLKPGGIALISLGGYSIRRRIGYSMPYFYKNIQKKLGTDYNPRFLVKSESGLIKLSSFFDLVRSNYLIELKTKPFVSKSQRGIAHWLIMKKGKNQNLHLPLKYLSKESRRLTQKYSKCNPVNWGVIDVYQLTNEKF